MVNFYRQRVVNLEVLDFTLTYVHIGIVEDDCRCMSGNSRPLVALRHRLQLLSFNLALKFAVFHPAECQDDYQYEDNCANSDEYVRC